MRRRYLALVLVALGALALGGFASAQDPPSQTGWWSRDPSAGAQPAGGFQVASVAGQPGSVAALRFATPSGVTSATLTLQETEGFVTPASSLQVCVTSEPWEPANPGPMDEAPTADCAAPVALERDAEALTWTAEVSALLPGIGGERSLMIVPGEAAAGGSPLDPGYRVAFSGATLAVVAAPGTTSTTAFSPNDFGGSGGGGGGGGDTPSFGGPSAPISGIDPVTPTTVAVPPPDPSDDSDSTSTGEAFEPPSLAAGATPGGGDDKQPWARLLFLVPLSAAIGVGSVYVRRLLQQRGVIDEPA